MRRYLKIGEVAHLLGVSTKTLRHYQKVGLLAELGRSEGGYRLYGGEDLLRLLHIRRLTALGLPLARIRSLLAQPEDNKPLRRALFDLRQELGAEIERLAARQATIDRLLAEEGGAGLTAPSRPPTDVEAALETLRGQLDGVDPETLDRAFELDRRLFGLLYELELPESARERLRQSLARLAADPSPLAAVLPLLARWLALAEVDEEAPEVEALATDLAAALPADLTSGGTGSGGPLAGILGEVTRGTLSPAQSRLLSLVRERRIGR